MRDPSGYNFTEHQISVILQLHFLEPMDDTVDGEKYINYSLYIQAKALTGSFHHVYKVTEMINAAWKTNATCSHRDLSIKSDKRMSPIKISSADRMNQNMRNICSDLTLRNYDQMVKVTRLGKHRLYSH